MKIHLDTGHEAEMSERIPNRSLQPRPNQVELRLQVPFGSTGIEIMPSESHRKTEEAIFESALSIANPVEREAYLKQACCGNDGLLQSVKSLIAQGIAREHDGETRDVGFRNNVSEAN